MTTPSASNCPPSTAAAVANEFLSLGMSEPNVPPIDQMKLQKLMFYAHAWHLAYMDIPLFEEDFEAWPWGPVVRDIYYQTSDYGRGQITQKVSEIKRTGQGPLDFSFVIPDGVAPELKGFIRQVWDTHKAFTGIQLSNSTHAPGEPWALIKERYGSLRHKPTIPNELIASVFKGKIAGVAASPANPAAR